MKQNEIVVLRKHGLNKCTSRQLLSQEFMKEIKTILNNLKDKLLILQWRMYSNSRLTVESTNKGIKWKCRDITRSTITLVTRMIMMSSWPNPTTTLLIDWTRRKALYYSHFYILALSLQICEWVVSECWPWAWVWPLAWPWPCPGSSELSYCDQGKTSKEETSVKPFQISGKCRQTLGLSLGW